MACTAASSLARKDITSDESLAIVSRVDSALFQLLHYKTASCVADFAREMTYSRPTKLQSNNFLEVREASPLICWQDDRCKRRQYRSADWTGYWQNAIDNGARCPRTPAARAPLTMLPPQLVLGPHRSAEVTSFRISNRFVKVSILYEAFCEISWTIYYDMNCVFMSFICLFYLCTLCL